MFNKLTLKLKVSGGIKTFMAKKTSNKLNSTIDEQEKLEPTEVETSNESNGIQEIWKFFSSMKLGLVLLLVISGVSIVGTLLPTDPQTGLAKFNIYGQFWFRGLLGLLCLNLLVCSINRWKFIMKSLGVPRVKVSENYLKNLKQYSSIRQKGSSSAMSSSLQSAMKSQGYRVYQDEVDGIIYLAGDKGRFGVLGSFLTHLSFIVITLGAIYGGLMGYEGYINAPEGQTFSLSNGVQWSTPKKPTADDDFQVRVNKFWIHYAPNGMVNDYYSDLTVLDNGKEMITKTIQVNDPLNYKGVKFYQSSYGSANIVSAKAVNTKTKKENLYNVDEQAGFPVEGTDIEVQVIRFIPDFDPSNPDQPRSNFPNNPAVLYALYKGGQQIDTNYKLLNTPLVYEDASVTFTGYQQGSYTGLSVRKDPGVPFVWLGCGLMVFGITLAYILQHRKVWAVIKEVNGITIADIGAVTDKNKLGLESDYNAIVNAVRD